MSSAPTGAASSCATDAVDSERAALPLRGRRRRPAHARRRGRRRRGSASCGMAPGSVENVPRRRLALDDGGFAVMAAVDRELGYAGVKAYAAVPGRRAFVVSLFDLRAGELAAVIEADTARPAAHRRGERRRREAPRAPRREHARRDRLRLAGGDAGRVHPRGRAAIERVVAYCRTPERLQAFCATRRRRAGREPPRRRRAGRRRHGHDLARPRPARRVAARGRARLRGRRERSARARARQRRARAGGFVCCDSREQARSSSRAT